MRSDGFASVTRTHGRQQGERTFPLLAFSGPRQATEEPARCLPPWEIGPAYQTALPDQGQQAVTDTGRIFEIAVKLGFEHSLLHDGTKGKQGGHDRHDGKAIPRSQ